MIRSAAVIASLSLLAACSAGSSATTAAPPTVTQPETTSSTDSMFHLPDAAADVAHVELLAVGDGRLILAYTTPDNDGRRLWVSVIDDGVPGEPVLITDDATDVPLDEFRPSMAVSPEGLIGIAWTSWDMDVFAAASEDDGASFSDPIPLNLEPRGMQVLPVIAYDGETLHAVWIDPRDAPENAEEPAELYMGTLSGDQHLETNLTESQTPTVCGCCRSHIQIRNGQVTVTFRNTTDDGYRDPYQINPGTDPVAVSPPVWEINACPVAGPVAIGDEVVWFDGSTGQARILASNGPDSAPDTLLESGDGYRITAGPRLVTGDQALVLVPGTPSTRILRWDGSSWHTESLELPAWATTAAVSEGRLIVVGQEAGSLDFEIHDAP